MPCGTITTLQRPGLAVFTPLYDSSLWLREAEQLYLIGLAAIHTLMVNALTLNNIQYAWAYTLYMECVNFSVFYEAY